MSRPPVIAALCACALAGLLAGSTATAASIQYTYDNLGHLTQATQTGGLNSQYQYDANGNVTQSSASNPNATVDAPLDISVTAGQSASLTFTATQGQSLSLNLSSIHSTTSGAVTISVYKPDGTLLTSTTATTSTALPLTNLSAGNYRVVITPPTGAGTTLQLTAASINNSAPDADAPLPAWAMLLLGMGLLGTVQRYAKPRPA